MSQQQTSPPGFFTQFGQLINSVGTVAASRWLADEFPERSITQPTGNPVDVTSQEERGALGFSNQQIWTAAALGLGGLGLLVLVAKAIR